MAQQSLVSISDDNDVIQELHWDDTTSKIEVVHEINLLAGKNARWLSTIPYSEGTAGFDLLINFYHLDPNNISVITEFIYDEYVDAHSGYDHVEIFPTVGSYYPLSQLNHAVAVKMNRVQGGGASKTSGEAL